MPFLILLLLVCGLLYWMWYSNNAVQRRVTSGPDADRRGPMLALFGNRLEKVSDPRLAATILMLQLVRTGSPITAAEKTAIMELMEEPLGIANIEAIFVRAWSYTDGSRIFSPVADDLVPMLRRKLTLQERLDLVDMLRKVAGAYNEPSELQLEAIARLKRRLTIAETGRVSRMETPFGD